MDYEVELDASPGRDQTEEALVVTWQDGRSERMRLHEYDRVYAVPGLYEEVVQNRLACLSPAVLTRALLEGASDTGLGASDLRVYDLGAGNGVVGAELRRAGVQTLVASDSSPVGREAAERDRPGLYERFFVGDTDEVPEAGKAVERYALNALVCAGALGLGHITAASFDRLWQRFPPGSLFAASVHERLAEPGGSDFGDYLAGLDEAGSEVVSRERFRHRLTMAGDPIHYVAVVVRKAG